MLTRFQALFYELEHDKSYLNLHIFTTKSSKFVLVMLNTSLE